jgi:transposase
VRELTASEGNQLVRIARKGSDSVEVRRALVVLASAQKMRVPEISALYHMSQEHIRHILHHFNEGGFASLKPRYSGGRPRTFTQEKRADIIELAQIPPRTLGLPFTHWSLSKLKETAEQKGMVKSISIETIRVILDEADITYQHTKTWKESNDPEFEAKKTNRSITIYPQTDG